MKRALLVLAWFAVACGACAQSVQDPTRPPAQLIKPGPGGPSPGAPQLQSILVGRGPGGRRVAVIDGSMVRIGDMVRGARVVGMTASAVLLQRGGKRETLNMMAPVEDAPAPVPAAAPMTAPPAAMTAPPAGKPE
jgi:MSHA biogenesis protein MshK